MKPAAPVTATAAIGADPRIAATVARYRSVDPAQSFPKLEEQILERWRERDVFHESVRRREGCPEFVFYEGPPTANGPPGSHHVLSRVFKDVFPRFKTMRGHQVHRKGGWDCHGLPVELQIERKLGFHHKDDIERYGVAEFNKQCRESVLEYIDEWKRLTERIALLGRHGRVVLHARRRLHRVGLVVAEAGLGEGPPVRGQQGRPVLHALRHGALLARGLVRLPRGRGPVALRALPGRGARRACPSSRGRRCRGRSCRTRRSWSTRRRTTCASRRDGEELIVAAALAERVLGEDAGGRRPDEGRGAARPALRAAVRLPHRLRRARPHRARRRLRQPRGRHGRRPHRRGLRRGRLPRGRRERRDRPQPGAPGRHVRRPHGRVRRRPRARRRRARDRGARRARPRVPVRALPALVSALLALRHAAHLLREALVVREDDGRQGRAAREQRGDQLAPGAHQARPDGEVARGQRRLGAVARPLLGHAAAGLALHGRRGARALRRLARRAVRARCRAARATSTGRTSTRSPSLAPTAAPRCAACRS